MKKLRNNSGATMLMAILLILVAAVVSAVILTAATSAARHLRSDRQAQQNYLAVSSAAELIRDSVLKDSYYWEQVSKKEKNEETGEETTVIESETETRPDGLLGPWLARGVAAAGCRDTVRVTVPGQEDLPAVQAAFSMDSSYNITVELSLEAPEGSDCRMTLTLQANSSGDDYWLEGTTHIIWRSVKWENPRIVKGIGGA